GDFSFPLQEIRAYGRTIAATGLCLLIIPAIFSDRGWRFRIVLGGTIAFFIYELMIGMRQGLGGDTARGALGALTYLLTFLALGVGLGRWLQTPRDADMAVRAIMFAALLFVAGIWYQFMINRYQVAWGGRLIGPT